MNKSTLTNTIAVLLLVLSTVLTPTLQGVCFSVGVFALSGAITNWLAIHMLFEKVPFLYGSGVVPNRFEEFKAAIKTLIIGEFFSADKLRLFLSEAGSDGGFDEETIDYERAYRGLVDAIEESPMGGFLEMVGGAEALEPLKEPMKKKMRELFAEVLQSGAGLFDPGALQGKIEKIVDRRLAELTPEAVKIMVQNMIKEHLGWLVVWGGVFGGLIGLLVEVFDMQ